MSSQYETQKYEIIKIIDKAEIRYYPAVMRIKSSRENGFANLFGYISGKNEKNNKIAMTTPVYLKKEDNIEVMEFILPSSYNNKNTPMSLSSKVSVYESNPDYYLALKFGGYAFQSFVNKTSRELKRIANENNIQVVGEPIVLVYNSPYKIFNRRNEILFKILNQNQN
tara:strand:- start:356 stop:859 length:504 start_codon:yes stop_codon:yes gene_type:complete